MTIEYGKKGGVVKWVKNPFTDCITYFNDIHKKTLAIVSKGALKHSMMHAPVREKKLSPQIKEQMKEAARKCVFCPGNEGKTPKEVLHVDPSEVPGREEAPDGTYDQGWAMRVVNNIIPRVPAECTGGSNESYVVIEDSRHFHPQAGGPEDLLYSGAISPLHFYRLMELNVEVMRRSYSNPAVHSVIIRKNQGAESGASQPHIHSQVMGADQLFPDLLREIKITESYPAVWEENFNMIREIGLIVEEDEDVVSYWSPYGKFPRSFDLVMPGERGLITELNREALLKFSNALHRLLVHHGPIPLDYEIHSAPGIPLHAHLDCRLFTYSNIAGTINVPSDVSEKAKYIQEDISSLKAGYSVKPIPTDIKTG